MRVWAAALLCSACLLSSGCLSHREVDRVQPYLSRRDISEKPVMLQIPRKALLQSAGHARLELRAVGAGAAPAIILAELRRHLGPLREDGAPVLRLVVSGELERTDGDTWTELTVGLTINHGGRRGYVRRSARSRDGEDAAATASRLGRDLASLLWPLPRTRSVQVVFVADDSAPVVRGIDQARSGKLDAAAITLGAAANTNIAHPDVPLYDLGLVEEARGRSSRAAEMFWAAWQHEPRQRYLDALRRVTPR